MAALAVSLDHLVPIDTGPLTSELPSSSGSPGVSGRMFIVTDQSLTGPRLDADTGAGWFTVGPAPVDAAANIPSSRTLGQGASQACAGNDPRLVGGAQATGDVVGAYPGPLTVQSIGGRTPGQIVGGYQPQGHTLTHRPGASDAISGLTDSAMAATNIDGTAVTASLRTLGTGAQQACAGNDPRLSYAPPIGSMMPYAGFGDPPETNWVIADGRLIDRTQYAAFYARVGHGYNGGVDPGGNKVKIPDKRGKKSVGAINMGSAAGSGPNDNAHHQAVLGTSYGEVAHTMLAGESGTAASAGGVGMGAEIDINGNAQDHSHSVSIQSGGASARHTHNVSTVWQFGYTPGSINTDGILVNFGAGQSTGADTPDHSHGVVGASQGRSNGHYHALAARNAASAHNNIDPCETDSYIIRIA